jgi:hypothetical protein
VVFQNKKKHFIFTVLHFDKRGRKPLGAFPCIISGTKGNLGRTNDVLYACSIAFELERIQSPRQDLNLQRWGKNEPRHDKTNLVHLRPAWIQTSLRIRAVWSGSMLFAYQLCNKWRNWQRRAWILIRLCGWFKVNDINIIHAPWSLFYVRIRNSVSAQ